MIVTATLGLEVASKAGMPHISPIQDSKFSRVIYEDLLLPLFFAPCFGQHTYFTGYHAHNSQHGGKLNVKISRA
jgi:hypothetical protein